MTAPVRNHRKAWISGLFALVAMAFSGAAVPAGAQTVAQPPHVSEVRVGLHGTRTRIVLDLDRAVKFDVFTLPEPYRVVLNLPEVAWSLDPGALPENKGTLSRMR